MFEHQQNQKNPPPLESFSPDGDPNGAARVGLIMTYILGHCFLSYVILEHCNFRGINNVTHITGS